MGLTIIEAVKLIQQGYSDPYIKRFVGSVQQAMVAVKPLAINLDDALVASMALVMLSETTEGRKLLKKQKRKNTQYKAEEFVFKSPERMVARNFVCKKISYPEALTNLEATFDGIHVPDERTLKRLLDDLIVLEERYSKAAFHFLELAGWDGTDATRECAANQVAMAVAGHVPGTAK